MAILFRDCSFYMLLVAISGLPCIGVLLATISLATSVICCTRRSRLTRGKILQKSGFAALWCKSDGSSFEPAGPHKPIELAFSCIIVVEASLFKIFLAFYGSLVFFGCRRLCAGDRLKVLTVSHALGLCWLFRRVPGI